MQHFPKSKSMKKNSNTASKQWSRSSSNEEVEAIKQAAMQSFIMPLLDICFSL